jgi:hypothetical protein
MLKSLILTVLVILGYSSRAQEFKFGFNFFPVTAYKLSSDKEFLILPDYTSVKLEHDWKLTSRKVYSSGIFLRYNKKHFVAKIEANYFNRYFNLGSNIIPPYQSTEDGYHLTLRYFTIEVPLYVGYTLNYSTLLKVTPFAGVSTDIGKMKTIIPKPLHGIETSDSEYHYRDEVGMQNMPPVMFYYTGGIELMYYGTFIQLAVKQNALPLLKRSDPHNANLTKMMMVEATLGVVLNKGGMFHTLWKGRQ